MYIQIYNILILLPTNKLDNVVQHHGIYYFFCYNPC